MYEEFDRGDAARALSYVHPSVETDPRHRVDGRVTRGHEALIATLAEWMGTWDGWSHQIEEIRDAGDQVLVIDVQRGRGRGSGVEWEGRFGMLYEVRDGQITRWTIFDDLPQALQAAGLRD